ncbi:MAG TPA: MATE family efflux transporter [Polyangiaceae bacterium]
MNLTREVRALALPAIAHSLLQTLVFVVDRAMLGHHDALSLAGMQIAGPVEWSVWSIFLAFEVGTVAAIGRFVGQDDRAAARSTLVVSLAYATIAGLAVAALTPLILAGVPLTARGATAPVIDGAKSYLVVTLCASPVIFLSSVATASLQAGGNTKAPLAIAIASNALHIVANAILIPILGMRGCAISTAGTFALETILSLIVLSRPNIPVSLRPVVPAARRGPGGSGLVDPRARLNDVFRVGWPSLLERVLYHAGFLGYVAIIGRLGDAVMAGNQALISVESICFMSADGFGIAAAALVAQKLGAKKPDEAKRATRIAARDAAVMLTTVGVLVFALRNYVLPVFAKDAAVVAVGLSAVPVLALAQPFMATGIVMSQALRGAGRTRTALLISLIGAVIVRLSATWLFAIVIPLGLPGVWLGSTCDWIVRAALLVVATRHLAREMQ